MGTKIRAGLAAISASVLLSGCSGDAKSAKGRSTPPAPSAEQREAESETPATPEPPKPSTGLGLSHAQLMKDLAGDIELERIAVPGGGYAFKGDTSDRQGNKPTYASVVAYGPSEKVYRVYFAAFLPYADYPDPAHYPDFMQRNVKLQEAFLANVFKGPVPEEVKAGLEWTRSHPDAEKALTVGGRAVKLMYGADQRVTLDVR